MFIAGDNEEAKHTVTQLLGSSAGPVIDLGGIENARWLEALSLAWGGVLTPHRERPTMPSNSVGK
jgi:predicted dinucleotide-binding enzyme